MIARLLPHCSPNRPLAFLVLSALLCLTALENVAYAQALTGSDGDSITASATTNGAGPMGIVPLTRGFNASVGTSSQHDSSNGWSSVLTPDAAYRFNRFFSVDVSVPLFTYINVEDNVGTKAKPVYSLVNKRGVLSDTAVSGHFETHSSWLDYNGTAVLGLPTGNTAYGLGAGQVTYNFNNHVEKSFDWFSPDIELGVADSNRLINERVRTAYSIVGTVMHFQAGGSVDLTHNVSFEADVYEELPLDSSTTYSTTGRGKKKVTTATQHPSGEDNGLVTSLDIPLSGHMTLSGFYNRSLRNHDDTAGFSLTFLLKAPPRPKVH